MADPFTEVDEDVRAERLRALALRAWPFALALALLVVAVVGIGAWRQNAAAARDARWSAQFFAAERLADDGSASVAGNGAAIAALRETTTAPVGAIRALARLRLAALLGDTDHATGATDTLDAIAADRGAPDALRQLATLLAVDRDVAAGSATASDRLRLETVEAPGAPFRALALDTGAMMDLAAGRIDRSRATLRSLLADDSAPSGLRERASTLLQAIGATGGAASATGAHG